MRLTDVLLDAYALLAVLRDEPPAEEVLAILDRPGAAISSLDAAEVLDRLCRAGASEEEAEADLVGLGADIAHPPPDVVLSGGVLRARHYHRRDRPVSLADCVGAAHALALGVPLATADGPLVAVIRIEGGRVHALPDAAGIVP